MGGAALLIYGSVPEVRLTAEPVPRSLIDRLLGRASAPAPAWFDVSRERRMITLPSGAFAKMGPAFTDYVANKFPKPWKATSAILEYLRLDITNVYVRGESAGKNPPEWYLQLTFSGCAGMAEVSAELAVHWAQRWYAEREAELLAKYFKPYNFTPNGRIEGAPSPTIFVPLGAAGYARFEPTPRPVDEEYIESRYLEIDASAMETLGDGERETIMRTLDEKLPPMLEGGGCRCQLCSPDFDAAACDRLVPFW